jgi:hypothetical protein
MFQSLLFWNPPYAVYSRGRESVSLTLGLRSQNLRPRGVAIMNKHTQSCTTFTFQPEIPHSATHLLPAKMELNIHELRKKVVSASLVLGVRFSTQKPAALTKAFNELPQCLHAN